MNKQDQTSTRFQELPKKTLGVGIFINKDNIITNKYSRDIRPNIIYSQAALLGENFVAFRFIPYNEFINLNGTRIKITSENYQLLSDVRCVGKCKTCDDCPEPDICICVKGGFCH